MIGSLFSYNNKTPTTSKVTICYFNNVLIIITLTASVVWQISLSPFRQLIVERGEAGSPDYAKCRW